MKLHPLRRFPLAVGTFGCALALCSCGPRSADNAVSPSTAVETANAPDNADANAASENAASENAASENAVENSARPGETSTNSAVEFSSLETIYVPGKGDLLHPQKVSRNAIDSQLKSGDSAAPGLQEIIEKAPLYFPKGAKINSTKADAKGMTVDLNRAFADDQFWSGKGEKTTELAVYALVNSAAKTTGASGTNVAKAVRFTIEKQPAQTLGEFDVSGELKPETRLNASS